MSIELAKWAKLPLAVYQAMHDLPAIPAGVDTRFDQSGRQEVVEQNGNTGEHYFEGLLAKGCEER